MVPAKSSALLGLGETNVMILPEKLVVKILVQLDDADLGNLISCSTSVLTAAL